MDIARYIADMTAQLESMAAAARFDMLAYFLGMAKAESELLIRMNPVEETSEVDSEDPAQDEQAQDDYHADNSFE